MDKSREVRRGPPMANGFLRRRPQRNGGGGGMRDSPEEGMAGELPESAAVRLRDRKKDRLNRNKRRRGERLHGNREEGGEESSEESVDVEDDEDDDDEESTAAANLRRTVQPPVMKIVKPQWKVTDEMIGVPVPRKARSAASVKRSHETSVSGSGERCPDHIPVQRPSSTSPATPSPAVVSPSSSNASIRRRVKPVGAKQKPAKTSKVSIQEEIEIEVAEVLFGLRQHPTTSANPETSSYTSSPKVEPKEEESSALAGKPRVISPLQPLTLPRISSPTAVSISSAVATQKRKRPRPGKSEEEKSSGAVSGVAPIGAPAVVSTKNDMEKMEASSPPKQENDCVMAAVNGVDRALKAEISRDAVKPHLVTETKPPSADGEPETKRIPVSAEKIEPKEEPTSTAKLEIDLDGSAKGVSLVAKVSDVLKEERFQIDLMAPPSKSMMDDEINGDSVMEIDAMNMKDDIDTAERKEEAAQMEQEVAAKAPGAEKRAEASEGCDATALSSERMLDLRLDAEKSDMEGGKQQNQKHSRAARTDLKALEVEKSATPSSGAAGGTAGPSSLPLGMHLAGWPGGLPPIRYIGQAPANWPGAPQLHAMVPMEGNSGAPPTLQPHVLLPQPRYKRCATHCYIAQMINYYQQLARINPYWAAASNASLFGAKAYNLNAMPSTEGMILSNTLPGGAFPAVNFAAATRTPSSVQEKGSGGAVNLGSHTSKEKASASLKQQPGPQHPTHPASAASIPQGAAVLFPLNQVAEAGRPGGIKAPVAGNAAGTAPAQVGGAMGGTGPVGMATVSYNFANLPTNDAQYIAMVQGSGFPFPIPAHVGVAAAATASSSYRGGTQGGQQGTATGAAVPPPPQQFFNGSFYASHVLHPAQVQQAQSQAFQQLGQQNPANSSGSSSSQKHHQQQQQRVQGNSRQPQQQRTPSQSPGNSLHPNHRTSGSSQPRQGESEAGHAHGDGDSSTMADSKVSPHQKSLYTPNNHLHQTLNPGYGISPVAVPMIMSALGGGKNGENQPQNPEAHLHYGLKGMELMPSQAFAMSFAPGVDFSMAPGHHAVFHSLPESYRQNYHLSTAQSAAVAAATQQQHAQRTAAVQKIGEDAKNTTDTVGGPPTRQEDRKAGSGKPAPPISSHSLTFSRQPENNNENSSISIFSSSSTHVPNQEAVLDNSSRTISLSSNPANGICASRPPPCATSTGQQQQQQHHQPAISHSRPAANNVGVSPVSMQSAVAISYPDRLLGSKFPGSLSALPQALVQGGAAPQSPQWRSTAGGAPSSKTAAPASTPSPPKQTKNSAGTNGPGSSSTAPTQISFGSSAVNPKVTAMSMTGHMPANSSLNGNPSIASPASVRLNSSSTLQVVSPPTSITKSTGGVSTRASTGSKGVGVPATSPTISQQNKSTPSSTSRKHSPPVGGRSNLPSILGHPQFGQVSSPKQPLPQQQPPSQPSNLKHQQQLSQQHQKPQFHQAHMLFANTYLPAQSLPPVTSAAATAGYYQTRPPSVASLSYQPQRRTASEQQQQQQNSSSPASSNPVATGVVSLGPPSLGSASDSLKSGGANGASLKSSTGSLPPHPSSTSSSAATNSGNHPNAASAVMAAFPYIHAVSTAPLKSAEQNSPAGKHKQEKIQ